MKIPRSKSQIPDPKRRGCARSVVFGIWLLGFWIFAASAAGCAKAQAKDNAGGPPLDVPSPPERVLAPVEEPVLVSAPPPTEAAPPAAAAPRTPPRPPVRRVEPEQPPPAAAAPTTAQPAPEPPRELRPASPAADAAAERESRDALARAARDLGRVDYGKLNPDARTQYDQSKRFMEQAQQALKDRNFVFAATLSDKAAALAAELVTR
jgi:type IV secretory pathway VirB10-like protein